MCTRLSKQKKEGVGSDHSDSAQFCEQNGFISENKYSNNT